MSRNRRLDYPNALHHILARGVNKNIIFNESKDYLYFTKKLGDLLKETGTECFAWALMPNHIHLLLKRTKTSISKTIHRLLTSYATYYNHKYNRVGHLFQNRFKSILCQSDNYFLTLIKYIHLNPLKANIVRNVKELEFFPWCGHQVLTGNKYLEWQNTSEVLQAFDTDEKIAVHKYCKHLSVELSEKDEMEIMHGSIAKLRNGKWKNSTTLTDKQRQRANELILGSEIFIRTVLNYNEKLQANHFDKKIQFDFQEMLNSATQITGASTPLIFSRCRNKQASKARALICSWCINDFQLPATEVAIQLDINKRSVYAMAAKGRELIKHNKLLSFHEQIT